MPSAIRKAALTEADYLTFEAGASMRHELVSGHVYAMAGASERHNRIAGNLFFHLRGATRGKTCRAFMADMKLRQLQGTLYYYPDVMLVCDLEDDHPQYKQYPCFIAEVLSPATYSTDLREKCLSYRAIPSLRYYLLVDSERIWAKCHVRLDDGDWAEQDLTSEDHLEVLCGDAHVSLCLEDIYEDTGLLGLPFHLK